MQSFNNTFFLMNLCGTSTLCKHKGSIATILFISFTFVEFQHSTSAKTLSPHFFLFICLYEASTFDRHESLMNFNILYAWRFEGSRFFFLFHLCEILTYTRKVLKILCRFFPFFWLFLLSHQCQVLITSVKLWIYVLGFFSFFTYAKFNLKVWNFEYLQ
jgi:hypothetical protein